MPTKTGFERSVGPRRVQSALLDFSRPVHIVPGDRVVVSIADPTPPAGGFEASSPTIELDVRLERGDGGGLRELIGEIVSVRSIDGHKDGTGVTVSLPIEVGRWLLGRRIFFRVLGAEFESDPPDFAIHDRIDITDESIWLLQYERKDGSPVLRLLVSEPKGIAGDGGPSSTLARAIAKQHEYLAILLAEDVVVRSRKADPTSIEWGRRIPFFSARHHTVMVHPPSLSVFFQIALGRPVEHPTGTPFSDTTAQLLDLLLIDRVVSRKGIAGVILDAPQSAADRRARFAVRTCAKMIRAGGVSARTVVDASYRSAHAYDRMLSILTGTGSYDRQILKRAFGVARWSQIENHTLFRTDENRRLPWVRFIDACESLCAELADNCRRPGYAPPSPVVEILDKYYRSPRRRSLEKIWRDQIADGKLRRVLEEARLSILRKYLQTLPRGVLLRAACGEVRFVRERLSSAFGRRGRRIFDEDLRAFEARVQRGEYEDWEAILSARASVYAVARRA